MALFFKRVFPTELTIERISVDEPAVDHTPDLFGSDAATAEYEADDVEEADEAPFGLPGAQEQEDDYLQAGLTIYLPGEELDPLKVLQNPTPYTVRIRPMQADEEVSVEDFQRMIRNAFAQLLRGRTLKISNRRTWRLLRNQALAAELGEKEQPDVLLIEERWGDPDKPLPDALYRLSRIHENEFLLDLIQRWEAEGTDDFDPRELLEDEDGGPEFGGWQFGDDA